MNENIHMSFLAILTRLPARVCRTALQLSFQFDTHVWNPFTLVLLPQDSHSYDDNGESYTTDTHTQVLAAPLRKSETRVIAVIKHAAFAFRFHLAMKG
jgi:hypothetical protein